MSEITQTPRLLWQPSVQQIQASRLDHYQTWLEKTFAVPKGEYEALWRWSVDHLDDFWLSIWQYFDVQADGTVQPVLGDRAMPGAQWFPNTSLNYAEHVFRRATDQRPALISRREETGVEEVSWAQLTRDVGALAASLRRLGIGKGDRVVSYMPNRPETVTAFLACASIGAVWSSCAPDMGVRVVTDRFQQIEPKLIFVIDSYSYNGKQHDRAALVSELLESLPTVKQVVHVPGPMADREGGVSWPGRISWADMVAQPAPLQFERVPFSHPLWIVYSSGTTGLPKAIVHSHGGIILTHHKTMALQHDLREGDRLLFLGGTGWIVWNLQVGGLLVGATVILYDGNPAWPDNPSLWRFIDDYGVTLFGCGAAYLINCMKDNLQPNTFARLAALRSINATGSPLPTDAFEWAYANIKSDLWLASISGGTDIASGFVACAPTLPVYSGEIQCRELGVAAYAFNEQGEPVVDEVGELVITQPMPSMPVYFWNDPGNTRYLDSYFDVFPGKWRHGDWIRFTPRGTSIIYGRSDSTINRFGIRMGTAEIYRVVEAVPEVRDSLVVDLEYLGRPSFMPLFVVLHDGETLTDELSARIAEQIRTKASPRHVPNKIYQVSDIPRTLTGKKMEVPVRRLLLGSPAEKVAHPDAMANPQSMGFFIELAKTLNTE
ncbi:acetoacetate--CoA ligase [Pusillimonas minor]|uniref:Acetoacetate--CoA ligase n=1 Tax=Pusillimonas minor TaxID=2697024 RepID=A0A842HNZ9_9BURK|nr:acetoacetate--CoA ligase [Pusillimonas minor]MBC2769936.1 acetoacetate--CoA ligase [Pusillimonas minor]